MFGCLVSRTEDLNRDGVWQITLSESYKGFGLHSATRRWLPGAGGGGGSNATCRCGDGPHIWLSLELGSMLEIMKIIYLVLRTV